MSPRRILIVEDEAVTSVMLEKTLKEMGYEVVGSAFDGREAIELAREKHPDLVLMDIRIQGDLDGIETAKQIYQLYDIPIIYLTAHSDEATIKRAVESGPFGYLIKPFKERELYSNIEMVAHKHKLYRTTTARGREPEPTVERRSETPASPGAPQPQVRPPDLRFGILAVQSLPHPVFLLTPAGQMVYSNNAFRGFYRLITSQYSAVATSIDDMPDLCRKIWTSGKERFLSGKTISITGPVQTKGGVRRFRVDMIPIMEKGVLHFIAGIILPGDTGTAGQEIASNSANPVDEAISRIKEIRFLASPEETYRLHQIVARSDEVLKRLKELKQISYPVIGERRQS